MQKENVLLGGHERGFQRINIFQRGVYHLLCRRIFFLLLTECNTLQCGAPDGVSFLPKGRELDQADYQRWNSVFFSVLIAMFENRLIRLVYQYIFKSLPNDYCKAPKFVLFRKNLM